MQTIRLSEWQGADFPVSGKRLDFFIEFLCEVWENRNKYVELDSEEEGDEELKNRTQRFFTFTHDGKIIARNYVGVIQHDEIRVEVYPKIFKSPANPKDRLHFQQNILFWLSYCRKIKFPFSQAMLREIPMDDWVETLIYIFANYTDDIISNRPFQAYQEVEEETSFLRGRLNFDNYSRQNISTGRWQYFSVTHDPFIYDNQFNRIVKFVSKQLLKITDHAINRSKLDSIVFTLHDVSDIQCNHSDCSKVKVNSLFADLNNVLDLCKLFLSNSTIDIDQADSKNFSFLLPMEYVFEDFIFGFIESHFPQYKFISQSTDFLAAVNERKVFQIRNDLYLKDQLIIDTKYKIRQPSTDGKAGVSQSDMYQMISYALKRNCQDVVLLYPKVFPQNDTTIFKVDSDRLSGEIRIKPIDINIEFSEIEQAQAELIDQLTPILNFY